MGIAQDVLGLIAAGTCRLTEIATTLGRKNHAVIDAVQQLKRRGFVTIDAPGFYQVTVPGMAWVESGRMIKGGQTSARPRTVTRGLRQRAWWVIRARKSVTLPELMSTLAEGGERDAAGNLGRYLRVLERSGFLRSSVQRATGCALTSPGHKRYRLVRDNGRLAPVLRQTAGVVFDPNTGKTFPMTAQAGTSALASESVEVEV